MAGSRMAGKTYTVLGRAHLLGSHRVLKIIGATDEAVAL